ncbi:hypothetical protein VDG1235_2155 [Verrucomicrobiia bacterium DG1235]|nr:hypothetical protein VDG1235_2155 [Verrucomicrobiae bacterium DG1235]
MKNPDFIPKRSDATFMSSFKAMDVPTFLSLNVHSNEASDPFPTTCLEPFQERFVEEIVECEGADDGLFAASMLSAWSGSLGKSFVGFHAGANKPTFPNLQVMVSTNQGKGKTVLDLPFEPFRRFEDHSIRQHELNQAKCEMRLLELSDRISLCRNKLKRVEEDSIEARVLRAEWSELLRQESGLKKGMAAPTFLEESITGPALIEALKASDDALMVQSSEAGGSVKDLLRSANSGSANFLDLLLKGYSVDPLAERRLSRGRYKGRPCIALSWFVQPDLGREIASNAEFRKRGLVSRWLFVERDQPAVEYERQDRAEPDASVTNEWRRMVFVAMQKRSKYSGNPVEIHWNVAACNVFRGYHNEIVEKRLGDWASHEELFVRARENAVRIAIGLYAARYLSGGSVTKDEQPVFAERAVEISRWFEKERFRHFQSCEVNASKDTLSKLIDLLLEAPQQEITLRDLENRNGYSKQEIMKLADLFPKRLMIKKNPSGAKGGRPSKLLKLLLG